MREALEPGLESDPDSELSSVKEALNAAGLGRIVRLPDTHTEAIGRITLAAQNYMREVKKPPATTGFIRKGDSENYVPPSRITPSDTTRRQYHDELSMLLLGKLRKELDQNLANRVSNFAAYLTGDHDYIGTF